MTALAVARPGPVALLLLQKVLEQAERVQHLLTLAPEEGSWRPVPVQGRPLMTLGELTFHFGECLAGFCAALYAAAPDRLAHFQRLREWTTSPADRLEEVRLRLTEYVRHVEEGFQLLEDSNLTRKLPTLFAPEGQPLFTILLANLEHLIHHKHQLFVYLRLRGVDVGTADLYRLPG